MNLSSGDSDGDAEDLGPHQTIQIQPVGKHFSRATPVSSKPALAAKPVKPKVLPKPKPVPAEQEGDDEDKQHTNSWFQDELKAAVYGGREKSGIKQLYKDKIAALNLRKSFFSDRALVFFVWYPKDIVSSFEKIGRPVVRLPSEKEADYLERVSDDSRGVGISLLVPHPDTLKKISPRAYLSKYSVPLAKIGKSYRAIKGVLKNNGFIVSRAKRYNFCWGFVKHRKEVFTLEGWQRFSHFSGCWQVGRKDLLWMNLNRKSKQFPQLYDFIPLTFVLKFEYEAFTNFKMKRNYWIVKPVDAARGEGIRVVSKTEPVKQSASRSMLMKITL